MRRLSFAKLLCLSVAAFCFAGCGGDKKETNAAAEAPPAAKVETASDASIVAVDNPAQFPLVTAAAQTAAKSLVVTGVVSPDISKNVPVVSIASGRVVDIKARLGDTVKKGQLLMQIQSADISSAFSDYHKAVADQELSKTQLERATLLYDRGAISLNDLQVAKDADTKAQVDVRTTQEHLRVLGVTSFDKASGVVNVYAPASGVITDQQIATAGGVQGLSSANLFTISDLSDVWILCDVYENDLAGVHLGETADIHLNAYPDQVLKGKISNIGAVLDPTLRTAKVRLQVHNPGMLRVGMFVTATFYSQKKFSYAAVPAAAILHLHDKDWVYLPAGDKKFRRVEVTAGQMLAGGSQVITSGLKPGDQVVSNALVLQNTVEQ